MAWQGILEESKSYMNYPHCGKLWFWVRYPMAWFKFKRCMAKENKGDRLDWKFMFKRRSTLLDNFRK